MGVGDACDADQMQALLFCALIPERFSSWLPTFLLPGQR
jgi:hypothetical protein